VAYFCSAAYTRNIGNSLYATSLVEAGQGLVRQLGAPRTYGVTLGYKF
jgi:iron complex outermembrane receptor protein